MIGTLLHHMLAYWDTLEHPAGLPGLGGQHWGILVISVQHLERYEFGCVSINCHNVGSDFSVIINVMSSIMQDAIFNGRKIPSLVKKL